MYSHKHLQSCIKRKLANRYKKKGKEKFIMQEKEYVSEYYPIILYYVIASEGLIYLFYNKEFIEPVNISHNGIHSTSINT